MATSFTIGNYGTRQLHVVPESDVCRRMQQSYR
jgi:hypothetical protein